MSDRWCNAVGVLKAATRAKLAATFPRNVTSVLDGWCATDPKQVKAWEANGTLFQRAQEVQELAMKAEDMARQDGITHLAAHEIYALYGGPSSRL